MKTKSAIDIGQPYLVLWKDSAQFAGWGDKAPETGVIKSIGYVVAYTGQDLTLSTSLNDEGSFVSPLSIPWICITKMERVELGS